MNKSGTYVWNEEAQKMIKVSDRVPPNASRVDVFFDGPRQYENLNHAYVETRAQKKALMNKMGVREAGDSTYMSGHGRHGKCNR